MFLADVIGTVVSPVQIPVLDGHKLLLLRPVDPEGRPAGRTRIGIDRVGAGTGDRVLVVDEGNSARQLLDAPKGAVKTVVVGFVDSIERDGVIVHDHRRPAAAPAPARAAGAAGAPAGAPASEPAGRRTGR